MGWYERVVFNPVMDLELDRSGVNAARRAVLARATGEVLDVGTGTGLNFPQYPDGVREIVSVTLDAELDARAKVRAAARRLDVRHVRGDAHELPFDTASFDAVVSTFLLCSVEDPPRAILEFARVLRPCGRLIFLEHAISTRRFKRAVQRVFAPLFRRLACGCSITRDPLSLLARNFELSVTWDGDLPDMPWLSRRVIGGMGSLPSSPPPARERSGDERTNTSRSRSRGPLEDRAHGDHERRSTPPTDHSVAR